MHTAARFWLLFVLKKAADSEGDHSQIHVRQHLLPFSVQFLSVGQCENRRCPKRKLCLLLFFPSKGFYAPFQMGNKNRQISVEGPAGSLSHLQPNKVLRDLCQGAQWVRIYSGTGGSHLAVGPDPRLFGWAQLLGSDPRGDNRTALGVAVAFAFRRRPSCLEISQCLVSLHIAWRIPLLPSETDDDALSSSR